jgi:hypothetical protein
MMADSFRQDLGKFERERVLRAWDDLREGQQSRLERLGVPTMFVTGTVADREVGVNDRD